MMNELNVRLALKSDTASNWASSKLILLKGEFAYETDTKKFKIGNGTDLYSDLEYVNLTIDEIKSLINSNSIQTVSLSTGDSNGQVAITVDGVKTNASVKGLGSSAYTDSSSYATSTQGVKADNAMPKSGGTFTGDIVLKGNPTSNLHPATKQYVDNAISNSIAASDAMIFKGTLGTNGTITELPTTYKTGWTYRIVTAGTYAGVKCEVGDLIIAIVDRNGSSNANSDWTVAQTNIDGAITNAGSGLSKNGSTISHDNSITANTLQGSNGNVNFGGSFTIPKITYNNTGHITEVGTTTVTLPTNPNTDTKVTQTVTTNNVTYPILLAPNGQTDTTTTTTYFDSGVTLNPSTNTITANITGNANTASSCSGNSKTATNLQTTRNFAISGGATSTSVAFNGSSNVTLNVTSLNTDYLNNGSNTLVLNCGASL